MKHENYKSGPIRESIPAVILLLIFFGFGGVCNYFDPINDMHREAARRAIRQCPKNDYESCKSKLFDLVMNERKRQHDIENLEKMRE